MDERSFIHLHPSSERNVLIHIKMKTLRLSKVLIHINMKTLRLSKVLIHIIDDRAVCRAKSLIFGPAGRVF